jgi:hypothetical protein
MSRSLAQDLKSQDRFRFWIVDYLSADAMRYRRRHAIRRNRKNAAFRFEPGDWFSFFEQHGWKAKQVRYLVEEAAQSAGAIAASLVENNNTRHLA